MSSKIRVRVNPEFYRPLDNDNLLGLAAKAKSVLGWEPAYSFESLVEEMVLSDIEAVKTGRIFSNTYLDWLVDESHSASSNAEDSQISGIGSSSVPNSFEKVANVQQSNGLEKVG